MRVNAVQLLNQIHFSRIKEMNVNVVRFVSGKKIPVAQLACSFSSDMVGVNSVIMEYAVRGVRESRRRLNPNRDFLDVRSRDVLDAEERIRGQQAWSESSTDWNGTSDSSDQSGRSEKRKNESNPRFPRKHRHWPEGRAVRTAEVETMVAQVASGFAGSEDEANNIKHGLTDHVHYCTSVGH